MQTNVGMLIRARGGFFDVHTNDGVLRCRARGKIHLDGLEPLPGDHVCWRIDPAHPESGIVESIAARKNRFIRPNVANVDKFVFVASCARPKTDPFLIDRMSVVSVSTDCEFVLCINKIDLEYDSSIYDLYKNCGFQVICTSAKSGEGIEELRHCIQDSVSVLSGNSGVGKSSLLNLLIPGLNLETADISAKHGRGRHTTRHAEFYALPDGGWIADTPGFAALEISQILDMKPKDLAHCFPEFPQGHCRFPDCLHNREPDCFVRYSVERNMIASSRYQSYLRLLEDCKD